jgi:hypothetical protein
MTESEWMASIDPDAMVEFLRLTGRQEQRRYRLFSCACVRRIWLLVLPTGREAVYMAERFADGKASEDELVVAAERAGPPPAAGLRGYALTVAWAASWAAAHLWHASPNFTSTSHGWLIAYRTARHARDSVVRKAASDAQKAQSNTGGAMRAARLAEWQAQAAILRDIFGNLFRPRPIVDAAWLAWNDGVVRKLAEAAYNERAFDRMPLLADALEDAGCTNMDILWHCRDAGAVHVRGCWVLDLLAGRE